MYQLFHILFGSLTSGEICGKINEPLTFSGHVSRDSWKSWSAALETLLRGTEIWIEELTKFPGTLKGPMPSKIQGKTTQCFKSFFQVGVDDDPLEISITRSPVKSRPRLDDGYGDLESQYDASNDCN